MPWPFRRRPTAPAARPRRAAQADTPPTRVVPGEWSIPRTDWCRLPPTHPTIAVRAPVTVHAARFGAGLAGARTMAASLRRAPRRRRDAPSGTIIDVARIGTVLSPEPQTAAVASSVSGRPEPIHRRVRSASVVQEHDRSLISTDVSIAFPELPPSTTDGATSHDAIQWSAERGFETSSGSGTVPSGRTGPSAAAPGDVDGEPAVRYVPAPGPRAESPAQDLVDLVERVTGIRVADASIDRSPEVSHRAAAIGAVAFTERATVHVPAELGRSDDPAVRAVIAHELTHVAQQRALGAALPREDSPQGRALEADARAVQASVSDRAPVQPAYLRRRPASSVNEPGVQRLRQDADPYAWQRRDPDEQVSGRAVGLEMLGLRSIPNSEAARDERHASEAWAEGFELREGATLQGIRNNRWDELMAAKTRQLRVEALRTGRSVAPLAWKDRVAVRAQLDEEMPYEFGPPHGVIPYPDMDEQLPQVVQPTKVMPPREGAKAELAHPERQRQSDVAGGTFDGGQDTHHHEQTAADRALARVAGESHGSDNAPEYGWQEREPTGREAATALFGDSFLGALVGKLAGDETPDRKAAEEDRLPTLLPQRQQRERELRHVVLREKRNEMLRAGHRPTGTIKLTMDEIAQIRATVDEQMPLEFAMPEYLAPAEDAGLDPSGSFERCTPEPAESPTATPGEAGDHEVALMPAGGSTAEIGAAAPAGGGTGATTPAQPATSPVVTSAVHAAGAVAAAAGSDHHEAASAETDAETARRVFSAASDLDIDGLTRRLYARIRSELRSELLIDRERAGALADAR